MIKGFAGLQCCLPAMVSQDVVKTEFKLVASYEGWEYVVLSHELGHHVEPEDRKLCVTVRHRQCAAVQLSFLTGTDHDFGLNLAIWCCLWMQVIEFESVAVVLGNIGIRVSLIAYPVVCVRKVRQQGLRICAAFAAALL